jgi:hypothetical protein
MLIASHLDHCEDAHKYMIGFLLSLLLQRKKERWNRVLTLLVQLPGFVIICVGLHGTETRMTDTAAHMHDKAMVDHVAIRCEPPGDILRCRESIDSFEARITKMYMI